ncbi:MAG: dicarboxylate/amino acid:cation symporter [Puniceicoccales bacterium]|jgi:Na+/H+-dicarboxylate symporter|nr:dicarboxylate/amino acid:cation symporter [Puniceicoccales bacterium]
MKIKAKKLFKEPIVWIAGVLLFCTTTYPILPIPFVRFALTISVTLKNLLLFFIPFLIFSGTATAFSSLKDNGLRFVLTLMGVIVFSNFLNLMFSGWIGCYLIPWTADVGQSIPIVDPEQTIMPIFYLKLPSLLSTTWALVGGISIGIGSTLFHWSKTQTYIRALHRTIMQLMLKGFIPTLPLFLMGFVLKLLMEGQLTYFVQTNAKSCLLMVSFLFFYLCIWFILAQRCSKLPPLTLFKNIFPAILTGATTMSSAAALPFSIEAAAKNTKNPTLANAVMPISLNFHMVGDTICIPVLAMIILNSFSYPMPSVLTFVGFGCCFVLNKFAGAGIPGGSIMISLPILQTYLGFNEEMLALITACYMLIDPLTTSGNVTANNLLIIFIEKAWARITKTHLPKKKH